MWRWSISLCILEIRENEHFLEGTRIREREIMSLVDFHSNEIPSFFTWILLSNFVPIGERWNFLHSWYSHLVKLSINEELVTKASSFHTPCKRKFSEAMRTYIFLAAIKVKVNCRKRILEEFNFLPLPPSGYIDENAYVLESYEFYFAFS